jgi:hypothetical protein
LGLPGEQAVLKRIQCVLLLFLGIYCLLKTVVLVLIFKREVQDNSRKMFCWDGWPLPLLREVQEVEKNFLRPRSLLTGGGTCTSIGREELTCQSLCGYEILASFHGGSH